jgi:uncharacterized protein YbcI
MSTEEQRPLEVEPQVELGLQVSAEMVRLYKETFGRGPVKGRTQWAGSDTIVVLLEATLTRAERNMVKMDQHQRLRDTRMFFQYATLKEFCEPVERLTGRKVRAFLSGVDTEVDGLSMEPSSCTPSDTTAHRARMTLSTSDALPAATCLGAWAAIAYSSTAVGAFIRVPCARTENRFMNLEIIQRWTGSPTHYASHARTNRT